MTKHFVLPDCQVKPGQDLSRLTWAGKFCVKHKPDVIICIGDFADLPSLSSYDVGTKSFEGRSYKKDIAATHKAMNMFMAPIRKEQDRLAKGKRKRWNPRFVLTLGNHEHRISRAVEYDRKLEDLMSLDDLGYKEHGWEVIPFLEQIIIDGVFYCHYATPGHSPRAIGSARQLLIKKHMSCVVGHKQGREVSYDKYGDGRPMIAIMAGSYYEHDEGYQSFQDNQNWRGVVMLHEVNNGTFDEMFVSINYLKDKYGS